MINKIFEDNPDKELESLKQLLDLIKRQIEICEANPELFDADYDKYTLEDAENMFRKAKEE